MFRSIKAAGSHRTGRVIAALVAAAALGIPAAGAAAADRDRGGGFYRRGGDHGHRGHGHGHSGHGHSGHGHRSHSYRGHDHHHHGHHGHHHGVGVHIGFPPIVFGSVRRDWYDPPVVYRERRVIVHEPAPVIVQEPPRVIYQPAPVVVQQPAQPVVVTAEQRPIEPLVIPAPVPDTVPQELSMQAFRSGGTIMVHISGVNTGGAYNTTLATGDLGLASPSVVLRNIQTSAVAGAPDTAFNVSLALNVPRPVTSVTVRFADQAHQVPIVDVPTSTQ